MLEEIIKNFLGSVTASGVTELFLWGIVLLFSYSVILSLVNNRSRFVVNTPNLLTSVGILGTFVGIVVGLMGFDPSNIDESIGLLLAGLKTAFITSLAGMSSAIIFKIFNHTITNKSQKSAERPVGELLEQLREAIAGNEESSLSGQIKLFRSDIHDNNTQRTGAFSEFTTGLSRGLDDVSRSLAKGATEQVINALKNVITDFNNQLTEQFGENFKALDSSVKRLVDWQENYRLQLEQMSVQYEQGVSAIDATKDSVSDIKESIGDIKESIGDISDKSQSIPTTMGDLQEIMEVNQNQISDISNHLEAFGEIKKRAAASIPEINQHITDSISRITEASNSSSSQHKQLLDSLGAVSNHQRDITNKIGDMQERMENSMNAIFKKQTDGMNAAFDDITKVMETAVSNTGESVNSQVGALDEAMQQEITRNMEGLGMALSQITGQFTSDYKRLVQSMKDVINTGVQN